MTPFVNMHIENPPYLCVVRGTEIVGLLKGPIPLECLQSGRLSTVRVIDDGLECCYQLVYFNVQIAYGPKEQFWYVLQLTNDETLAELKQIRQFR